MKKIGNGPGFFGHPLILKIARIMKIAAVIILATCLQVSANGFSQNRISLTLNAVDIKKALSLIEKKSDFRFLYNQSLVSDLGKVNVVADNEKVTDVLDKIFANTGVSYKVLANNLVVLKEIDKIVVVAPITGRVVSPTGEPIVGVSVTIEGTSTGTSTDADGRFTIDAPEGATLVFSSVGFTTQEIKVAAGQTAINITLQPSTNSMDEVVVIGYGTANKRDLTGSIAKVAGRDVADRPNPNPIASIQGKVSGVSVINSGKPGQEPDIRIRGTISRYQTKPLYVVDGLLNDNINFVNPADIESMEVLKDPSSLAIFGVRGANGVIIVTTKKGRTGQLRVNLASTFGVKKIVDKVEMVDAAGFKELYDEQRANQGSAPYQYYDRFQGNTDWVDLIQNKGAIISTNSISLSSGTEKNKFYMGVGYIREEGLIKYEKLDKITLNVSDELKVSKALKFGFNINGYRANLPRTTDFIAAINATPIVEPFNEEFGVFNKLPEEIGGPQIGNPLMDKEELRNTDLQREYRAIGSVYGEVTFLKNFTFRSSVYADLGFNNQRRYTPIINVYAAEIDTIAPQRGFLTTRVFQKENTFSKFQQEHLLTFKKDFGEHGLTAMGGFTTYYSGYSETNGSVAQSVSTPIPRDKRFWYLDNFFADPSTRTTAISTELDAFGDPVPLEWEQTTVSYLLRALYNYQGKYLLNASFRRDGSSEISPANRYQNFIAVGAAWEMTREDFMADQNIFDFLKIKASWGTLGNQYVGIHYPFFPRLRTGATTIFGDDIIYPAFTPSYTADSTLKWETVRSVEGGFELSTLQKRLTIEAVYYSKVTDNLLVQFPGLSGQKPGITNAGKIENRGIEASATWSESLNNNFSYSISGNITTLKNEVKELFQEGFEIIDVPSRTTVGFPIGYFYGYEVAGVYQTVTEKEQTPDASSLGDYGPGDLRFRDLNGDGQINVDDRTLIGNPTPDFIYGLSASATYKGFDVAIDMQGVYGNEIYRDWGNGNTFAVFNYRKDRLARWNGPETSNWEPQVNDTRGINKLPSTYMIEDGSYFRIRNLQIGYNFNPNTLKRAYIKTLRLFLNAQNLKTFKNNSGFTPEFGGSAIRFGIDDGSYPIPAIYSAGINVTF